MRRISKGFSGVDTPLFDGMLVKQQVQAVEDAVEDVDDDYETYVTLTKQVANLDKDKIAQAIEITKLKQRVRRLEKKRQFKSSGLKRLRKVRTTQRVESSADTVMDDQEDASKHGGITKLDVDENVTLVDVEEDIMQDTDEAEPAEVEEVIEVVTATKLMTEVVTTAATTITATQVPKASAPRRRRGVVIQDPKEISIASVVVHPEDEAFSRQLEAELNANINYDDVMEQARKNMMIYLKNMDGIKMDFFKAKKQRIDEESEELKTHLQIVDNDDDNDVYTEATPLALKVPVVDYHIHHEHNKPYYKIIKADGNHQLFLSFITLLKNFDRKDLEALWKLSKERFESEELKNFSDDFLLNTLKIMYEKPIVKASVWRDQKGRYRLEKVKSWKLFESCGVHIITLTTTQLILLVEKKYLLKRFTLKQMLNNVRLEVEEESEMSLELLRNGYALSLNTFCKPIRVFLGL
nr:hypothetical protein [Tanacetum cinerariifolium]